MFFFFLKDTAHTEIYPYGHTLSLNDSLPIFPQGSGEGKTDAKPEIWTDWAKFENAAAGVGAAAEKLALVAKSGDTGATADAMKALGGACGTCHKDRKSTRLNSSH